MVMKMFFIVHGTVQGVGYRAFVKFVADKYFVRGMVRNVSNGTVEILAIADEDSLKKFEMDISVYDRYGPQVFHIERIPEGEENFPSDERTYSGFIIEKDEEK